MKEFFGYGRKRDESGAVVKRFLNTYVNCLHTQIGHARENMEVLVAEFDMSEIKYIGQMSSSQNSRVIDLEGISYAVTNGHKDGEPKIIERDTPMKGNYTEPRICTMVGRDPNNSSSRARSDHYEQFLEMGDDVSNTLTSVQKDNLLAEPMVYDDYNSKFPQDQNIIGIITTQIGNPAPRHGFKIVEGVSVHPNSHALEFKGQESIKQDAAPSLRATDYKAPHCVWEKSPSYRIRKLTPRECFRLMGVTEADIDKIQQSGVSQSQQYKMAGNSIVVDCLYHMFRKMFTETACESQQLSLF